MHQHTSLIDKAELASGVLCLTQSGVNVDLHYAFGSACLLNMKQGYAQLHINRIIVEDDQPDAAGEQLLKQFSSSRMLEQQLVRNPVYLFLSRGAERDILTVPRFGESKGYDIFPDVVRNTYAVGTTGKVVSNCHQAFTQHRRIENICLQDVLQLVEKANDNYARWPIADEPYTIKQAIKVLKSA